MNPGALSDLSCGKNTLMAEKDARDQYSQPLATRSSLYFIFMSILLFSYWIHIPPIEFNGFLFCYCWVLSCLADVFGSLEDEDEGGGMKQLRTGKESMFDD